MHLESFDQAKEYKSKRRPIDQPVYNDARLRERPIPHLLCDDESNSTVNEDGNQSQDDDNFSLSNFSGVGDSNETETQYNMTANGSNSNDNFQFASNTMQNNSIENLNGNCQSMDEKIPLADVEINAADNSALSEIFGDVSADSCNDNIDESSYTIDSNDVTHNNNLIGMPIFKMNMEFVSYILMEKF